MAKVSNLSARLKMLNEEINRSFIFWSRVSSRCFNSIVPELKSFADLWASAGFATLSFWLMRNRDWARDSPCSDGAQTGGHAPTGHHCYLEWFTRTASPTKLHRNSVFARKQNISCINTDGIITCSGALFQRDNVLKNRNRNDQRLINFIRPIFC